MSEINELYDKIGVLLALIDNEPKNSIKRKVKIELEIEELEKEKQRARFHNDELLVVQYNEKIKKLKSELNRDYISVFKSKIQYHKQEILDIIVDYYNHNITIDEIIVKENIPSAIYEKWFEISDFGKNTGYLFVKNISYEGMYWCYSNPINEVILNATTLDELKEQIIDNDEILLKFDDDLIIQSEKRDVLICQGIIDEKSWNLNDFENDVDDIFNTLKQYFDKFTKEQLIRLAEIMLNKPYLGNSCDLKYIMDNNVAIVGSDFLKSLYPRIIESKLRYLDFNINVVGNIIADLNVFADYFSENQVFHLKDLIEKAPFYQYSREFRNILKVNGF